MVAANNSSSAVSRQSADERHVATLLNAVPPHAPDAERALLGSMILDPRIIPEVMRLVPHAGAFHIDVHAIVYTVLVELWCNTQAVDKVLLLQKLRDHCVLDQIGGEGGIMDLAEAVPTATNFSHYAEIIVNQHRKRALRQASLVTLEDVLTRAEPEGGATELVERAQVRLAAIAPGASASCVFVPVRASNLIKEYPNMREPAIDGLLRVGEVMNIVAPPKMGKSWLVHQLVLAVPAGEPWLGRATTPGAVLLIDGELHPDTLAARLRTVRDRMTDAPQSVLDLVDTWTVRGQRLSVDDLLIKLGGVPVGHYRVIVIDALYRFLPRDGEENRNETMIQVYNALDALAKKLGAAIVVIHHASKGPQWTKEVTDVGSGAGAQSRAADTHMVIRAHEAEGAAIVQAVVRSWKPFDPIVIRDAAPGWTLDTEGLDPTAFKGSNKSKEKKDKAVAAKDAQPKTRLLPATKTPGMTPAEFTQKFITNEPSIGDEIVARAGASGIGKTEALSLLKRAVADQNAFKWKVHREPVRYSTKKEPVFGMVSQ